jgi:hypothetical protein
MCDIGVWGRDRERKRGRKRGREKKGEGGREKRETKEAKNSITDQ